MTRAPFQVLVIPFQQRAGQRRYAVVRRADMPEETWQWVAGGGELGEDPADAARREAREEAGIGAEARLIPLSSRALLPVHSVCGPLWGPEVTAIPEHAFGVEVSGQALVLSQEHVDWRWVSADEALALLRWESNRAALRELEGVLGAEDASAPGRR